MLDGRYYKGFEGEIDVDIYYINKENECIGFKLWEGYFENILSGAYADNFKDDGLFKYYTLHEGWYDEAPWEVPNISTVIGELKRFDENNIEPELKNMFPILHVIKEELISLFEECKDLNKTMYIAYDN